MASFILLSATRLGAASLPMIPAIPHIRARPIRPKKLSAFRAQPPFARAQPHNTNVSHLDDTPFAVGHLDRALLAEPESTPLIPTKKPMKRGISVTGLSFECRF